MMFDPSPRIRQELLRHQVAVPYPCDEKHISRGMQVIMRKTNYYLTSRAKCFIEPPGAFGASNASIAAKSKAGRMR